MRKSIKAIACAVSALVICAAPTVSNYAGLPSVTTITAEAANIEATDRNWEFCVLGNGNAQITKYKGKGTAQNVVIPKTLTNPSDKKVYKVTSLLQTAFNNTKDSIASVKIQQGITDIPSETFKGASNLTQVTLPEGLVRIWTSAFEGTKIQKITLPSSLQSIDKQAFYGTPLISVTFSGNSKLKEIGDSAFQNTRISSISIPSTVTKIGERSFCGTPLTSVTIRSGLKEIGKRAFENTKITSITIPSTVSKIGEEAFIDSKSLNNVTFDGYCSMNKNIFSGCSALKNINMTIGAFDEALKTDALGNAPSLKSINNTQIVNIDSNGMPYFAYPYQPFLIYYFAEIDAAYVSFMNDYLDAMLDYVVKTETAGCQTKEQKIRKLHDWVCNKVSYAVGPDGKADKSPESHCDSSVFFTNKTVCDGYARALTLLLQKAGFEAYYVGNEDHAWTIVRIYNSYYHIDACHDDELNDYSHFLVSDKGLKKCSSYHDNWAIPRRSFGDNRKMSSASTRADYSNYTYYKNNFDVTKNTIPAPACDSERFNPCS